MPEADSFFNVELQNIVSSLYLGIHLVVETKIPVISRNYYYWSNKAEQLKEND